MIHPLQPFRGSKHLHIHQSVDSRPNEQLYTCWGLSRTDMNDKLGYM